MPNSQDISGKAISEAAEVGLSSQLDQVDNLDVNVETDTGKLMQGDLDSVEIAGEGLVMEKDLRTQKLDVETNQISIDPLKAVFGDIELEQPTKAVARVVLTQEDIERAFNSKYIQQKLEGLEIEIAEEPVNIKAKQIKFKIVDDRKVHLFAQVMLPHTQEVKEIAFSAIVEKSRRGHKIELDEITYLDDQRISPDLTGALVESAEALLDLRNFELEGMTLRLEKLTLQPGQITIQAQTQVTEFPDS
jgi:hypothetical protein